MVMIWNQLARGDGDYCAILVVINSVLQVVLYSPYALLFVNVIGNASEQIHVSYGGVAISVLIVSLFLFIFFFVRVISSFGRQYLGIPLVAGVITRYGVWLATSREFLDKRFLPAFGPLALIGLLYTIVVMFAYQGKHIVHNLGPVFRVFVPMILYFVLMWTGAFALVWTLGRRKKDAQDPATGNPVYSYEMAVVQSFTAGSNNFVSIACLVEFMMDEMLTGLQELAIAVAIAVYGVGSDQALAATIGPLVEVPVLLSLTWVALWLHGRLHWPTGDTQDV
jgi:arsenite transporter